MIRAMIISVGGTPAPIIKSITKYRPEFVSFFASQDTCDHVTEIKKGIQIQEAKYTIKSEITLSDEVNDLYHCFSKAEEAVKRVLSKGFRSDEVIVDYTGGTKNMSVALSLSAVAHGFNFSYVGGTERTKGGVGTVVDGKEEVYESVNPWDFLAIDERKKISFLFNTYQFKAAKALVDDILEKNTSHKSIFKKLGFIIDGYYSWDIFRHGEAVGKFERARIEELLETDDERIRLFARATLQLKPQLEFLSGTQRKPDRLFALDIFSNAERRFEEGKIDDAVVRLYRLVEMLAQERLLNNHGIDTGSVIEEKIPQQVSDEFIRKYKDRRDGKIKVSQNAAFELLEALEDDLGKEFQKRLSHFRQIQSQRNNSYLVHGFACASDNTYKKFREFILGLNIFSEDEVIVFPRLNI
ncbi:MAG: TIGR02710 family CRISPR-associated protein [wastewater metagenome]|nr:TIGR02710 family CRISPR-associated protein [Candidatus Loosdrechtia aerotolerans]